MERLRKIDFPLNSEEIAEVKRAARRMNTHLEHFVANAAVAMAARINAGLSWESALTELHIQRMESTVGKKSLLM